jgi:hypothetical protein
MHDKIVLTITHNHKKFTFEAPLRQGIIEDTMDLSDWATIAEGDFGRMVDGLNNDGWTCWASLC